jgi:hypothetical protein
MDILDEIQFYYNKTIAITLSIIGVFGNTIVFLVYNSKEFSKHSMNRYISILAIIDTISLLLIWTQIETDFFNTYQLACKFQWLAINVFYQFCSVLIVTISIDRYFNVLHSKKNHIREKLPFQIAVVFVIFLALIAINTPYFIYYDIRLVDNETLLCCMEEYTVVYLDLFIVCHSLIFPCIIMLFCSIKMYIKVRNIGKIVSRPRGYRKEVNMLKLLVSIIVFYFVTNAPVLIGAIFTDLNVARGEDVSINLFIYDILNSISYIHNSCSIFIHWYVNKIFRKKIKSIFVKQFPIIAQAAFNIEPEQQCSQISF